jgi:hypothetical protein
MLRRNHPSFPDALFGHTRMTPPLWRPNMETQDVGPYTKTGSWGCTPWVASPLGGEGESHSKSSESKNVIFDNNRISTEAYFLLKDLYPCRLLSPYPVIQMLSL